MIVLPIELLSQACRIFFQEAYPAGVSTAPEKTRPYAEIPTNASIDDYLLPAPNACGICQTITGPLPGYRFRLGCAGFRHLKLVIQQIERKGERLWLASVDTHDSWHGPNPTDPAAQAEAKQWVELQQNNRQVKSKIEKAWAAAGLLTQNRLLRMELDDALPFRSAKSTPQLAHA